MTPEQPLPRLPERRGSIERRAPANKPEYTWRATQSQPTANRLVQSSSHTYRSSSLEGLSAIDHHRPDAEAEQAPEPDALHRTFERDVERRVDKDRRGIAADEQEQVGPFLCVRGRGPSASTLISMPNQDMRTSAHSTTPGIPARANKVMCALCGLRVGGRGLLPVPAKPSASARFIPNPLPVQKLGPWTVSLMMISHQLRRHCLVPSVCCPDCPIMLLAFSTIWWALTGRSIESLASSYSPKVASTVRRTVKMQTAATIVVSIRRNRPSMSIANYNRNDDGERRSAIGRADKGQRGEPNDDPERRDLSVADQDEDHGARQMRSDRARADVHDRHRTVQPRDVIPPVLGEPEAHEYGGKARQHYAVVADHRFDPACVLKQ